MSERSVEHATFAVERTYPVSPERAFAAWADPVAKAQWYVDADAPLELDFRVGGRERHGGAAPDGRAYGYEAIFHDIVADQRIVYTYAMSLEGTRISVSLATVEFTAAVDGSTRMLFTEQGAYLDGHQSPQERSEGMGSLLDRLSEQLPADPPGPAWR